MTRLSLLSHLRSSANIRRNRRAFSVSVSRRVIVLLRGQQLSGPVGCRRVLDIRFHLGSAQDGCSRRSQCLHRWDITRPRCTPRGRRRGAIRHYSLSRIHSGQPDCHRCRMSSCLSGPSYSATVLYDSPILRGCHNRPKRPAFRWSLRMSRAGKLRPDIIRNKFWDPLCNIFHCCCCCLFPVLWRCLLDP